MKKPPFRAAPSDSSTRSIPQPPTRVLEEPAEPGPVLIHGLWACPAPCLRFLRPEKFAPHEFTCMAGHTWTVYP